MKRVVLAMMSILLFCTVRCTDDEVYKDIPSEIVTFLTKYYPGQDVATYTESDNTYKVVLTDGPTIVFDKSMSWRSIDGNGSVLGQELLFDQLPSGLYEYLQSLSAEGDVFAVSRTPYEYTVSLLTSKITYDDATGEITSA